MDQDRPPNKDAQPPFPIPVNYEYSQTRPVVRRSKRSVFGTLLRVLLVLALIPVVLVPLYWLVPPVSTLMLWRWVTLQRVERVWTPIS